MQPSLHFLAHSGFRRLPGSHKVLVPRGTPYNSRPPNISPQYVKSASGRSARGRSPEPISLASHKLPQTPTTTREHHANLEPNLNQLQIGSNDFLTFFTEKKVGATCESVKGSQPHRFSMIFMSSARARSAEPSARLPPASRPLGYAPNISRTI